MLRLAVASLLLAAVAADVQAPDALKKQIKKLEAKEAAARHAVKAAGGARRLADDGGDDDDALFANLTAPCFVAHDYVTCASTECSVTFSDDDDDGDDGDDDDDDVTIATCADAAASPGFLEACTTWPAEFASVCPACSSLLKDWVGCFYSNLGTFAIAMTTADDTVTTETCDFSCTDTMSAAGAGARLGAAAFGLCLAAGAL